MEGNKEARCSTIGRFRVVYFGGTGWVSRAAFQFAVILPNSEEEFGP